MKISQSCKKFLVLLPAAVALLWALFFLLQVWQNPDKMWRLDSASYLNPAHSVMEGEGFLNGEGEPDPLRTPGYPLFLSTALSLGGLRALPLMQLGLWIWIVVATAASLRLLDRRWPTVKGWTLLWFAPHLLIYSLLILSETLFTAVMIVSLLTWLIGRERRHFSWFFLSGVSLALLPLIRPIGLLLLLPAGVVLAIDFHRVIKRDFFSCKKVVLVSLLALLLVAPTAFWMVRNQISHQMPALTNVSAINLFYYDAPELQASMEGRLFNEVQQEWRVKEDAWLREHPDASWGERSGYLSSVGKEYLLAHPFRALSRRLISSCSSFLPEVAQMLEISGVTVGDRGTLSILKRDGVVAAARYYLAGSSGGWPILLLVVVWTIAFYLVLMISVVRMVRDRCWRDPRWLLFALALLQIVAGGAASNPRFLVAPLPLLLIVALRPSSQGKIEPEEVM